MQPSAEVRPAQPSRSLGPLRQLNLERAVKAVGTPAAAGWLERAAAMAERQGDAPGAAELRLWAAAARTVQP
jgi:hypothetical protein